MAGNSVKDTLVEGSECCRYWLLLPVMLDIALGVLNLVSTLQSLVEAFDQDGHTIGRVQTLIRVHLSRRIGVSCHLQDIIYCCCRSLQGSNSSCTRSIIYVEEAPEHFKTEAEHKQLPIDSQSEKFLLFICS